MRTRRSPLGAICILLLALVHIHLVLADPLGDTLDLDVLDSGNGTLSKRCAGTPCGYYSQLCCLSGETCITDSNNQAQCSAAGGSAQTTAAPSGDGHWQYYTSTWIETNTVTKTSVYSSWMAASATPHPTTPVAMSSGIPVTCKWDQGESSCGNICCPSGQYCQVWGQCGASSSVSASAPLRPTSSGTGVVTQTSFSTTTTVPFETPIATGQSMGITQSSTQSSGGLSGGAIAGIVIAVIVAIIILILLCLCLCFKAAWDGLLALFGLGKRRRNRREVVEYESYHRSGHAGNQQRTWYGGRPARLTERTTDRREKRSGAGAAGLAAGLGGLAVALGIKRKRDDRRRREEEKSEYSDSYISYSDYTASSDRRTRDTRRSRR